MAGTRIATIPAQAEQRHYTSCKMCGSKELKTANTKHQLTSCQVCGFAFHSRMYTEAELTGLYNALYNEGGGYDTYYSDAFEKLKRGETPWLGFERKAIVERVLRDGARVVGEIGASMGMTAQFLKRSPVEYHGLEFDAVTAGMARQLGFNITQGDHTGLKSLPKKLDALVAFEVLEHVPDIKECLEDIRACLSPGGLLGLTVPNYDRRLNTADPEHLGQSEPPLHLNFWTKASLQRTLEMSGFKVKFLQVRRRPNIDPKRPLGTLLSYVKVLFNRYHGPTLMCVAQKA